MFIIKIIVFTKRIIKNKCRCVLFLFNNELSTVLEAIMHNESDKIFTSLIFNTELHQSLLSSEFSVMRTQSCNIQYYIYTTAE